MVAVVALGCALAVPAFGQIEGKGLYVAVGSPDGHDKEGMLGVSEDGVKWNITKLADVLGEAADGAFSGVAYGNGLVVAVGGKKLITSSDLATWKTVGLPKDVTGLNAVAFGNGMFVAAGDNSSVVYSRDGADWRLVEQSKGKQIVLNSVIKPGMTHVYGVVFHEGKFYLLGNGNMVAVLSPGGDSLTLDYGTTLGKASSRLNDMAFGAGKLVAVGTMEDYLSTDLVKWSKIDPYKQYWGVAFGAGNFVAVTGYGELYFSPSGESGSWKIANSAKLSGNAYSCVAFGKSGFVAGAKGLALVSKDGETWKKTQLELAFKKIVFIP
jgi:hypothetical protein